MIQLELQGDLIYNRINLWIHGGTGALATGVSFEACDDVPFYSVHPKLVVI